jgi:hypothetical protein
MRKENLSGTSNPCLCINGEAQIHDLLQKTLQQLPLPKQPFYDCTFSHQRLETGTLKGYFFLYINLIFSRTS